jgi:hypothetical protein
MRLPRGLFPFPQVIWRTGFEMRPSIPYDNFVKRLDAYTDLTSRKQFHIRFDVPVEHQQGKFVMRTRTPYLTGHLSAELITDAHGLKVNGMVGVESDTLIFLITLFILLFPFFFINNLATGMILIMIVLILILVGYRISAEALKQKLLKELQILSVR